MYTNTILYTIMRKRSGNEDRRKLKKNKNNVVLRVGENCKNNGQKIINQFPDNRIAKKVMSASKNITGKE